MKYFSKEDIEAAKKAQEPTIIGYNYNNLRRIIINDFCHGFDLFTDVLKEFPEILRARGVGCEQFWMPVNGPFRWKTLEPCGFYKLKSRFSVTLPRLNRVDEFFTSKLWISSDGRELVCHPCDIHVDHPNDKKRLYRYSAEHDEISPFYFSEPCIHDPYSVNVYRPFTRNDFLYNIERQISVFKEGSCHLPHHTISDHKWAIHLERLNYGEGCGLLGYLRDELYGEKPYGIIRDDYEGEYFLTTQNFDKLCVQRSSDDIITKRIAKDLMAEYIR